jgi:hypothetical protein
VPRFLNIHFNILFPSMPISFKWSLPFRFPNQNFACYMSHSSYSPLIIQTIFGEEHQLQSFTASLLNPSWVQSILLSTLFSINSSFINHPVSWHWIITLLIV